jgi:hypothetical protein
VLSEHVVDFHRERGADAGERIDYKADQGAIARVGAGVDDVEQPARFVGRQYRRIALLHDMAWPAHRGGRVHRHDLTDDGPVGQLPDGSELLLDRRRRQRIVTTPDESFDEVATCTGCAAAIEPTPARSHQAKNSATPRA